MNFLPLCCSIILSPQKNSSMKSRLLLFAAICVAATSFATIHTVAVADFSFTPGTFTAHVGDTVRWVWSSGSHTTTSTSVPAGAASWDQNITASATSYTYVITRAGAYAYKCTPHVSMGMAGGFIVTDITSVEQLTGGPVLNMYPNPVSDVLHIEIGEPGVPVSLALSDIRGKQVMNVSSELVPKIDVSVRYVPAGLYFISGKQGDHLIRKQVVITH
jgi:plastocyanin